MGHQIIMDKRHVADQGIHTDPRGLTEDRGLAAERGTTEGPGLIVGGATAARGLTEGRGARDRVIVGTDSAGGPSASAGGPSPESRPEVQLFRAAVARGRALLRVYVHARKVRAAGRALADALAESREVSSWPGDRLPVGAEISEQVEQLTRRLTLELQTHGRLEQLLRTAGGHSVPAH